MANLDNLASDMARGEGETLASLAVAMQAIGMDYYGLIVLVEEGKGPVQWGITLTYEPK